MNRQTRSRLLPGGVPTCSNTCRWPRGACPTHPPRVVEAPDAWMAMEATGCKSCGYLSHAPHCPTLAAPKREREPERVTLGAPPRFVAGDRMRCVDASMYPLTAGKVYEALRVRGDGDVTICGDDGQEFTLFSTRFTLAEPERTSPTSAGTAEKVGADRPGWEQRGTYNKQPDYWYGTQNVFMGSGGWRVHGDMGVRGYHEDLLAAQQRAEQLAAEGRP